MRPPWPTSLVRPHDRRPPCAAGTPGAPRGASASRANAVVDCGWGGCSSPTPSTTTQRSPSELRRERAGERDIAFYLRDPHVVLALAPQELFLDPSHTYRLWLEQLPPARRMPRGLRRSAACRPARRRRAVNRIYAAAQHGARSTPEFVWPSARLAGRSTHLVAEDDADAARSSARVTGVDHVRGLRRPRERARACGAWRSIRRRRCRGVGEALVRHLAEHYFAPRRALHGPVGDARQRPGDRAVREARLPARAGVLRQAQEPDQRAAVHRPGRREAELNPYARIIVDEARRRGIGVEVLDAESGYFAPALRRARDRVPRVADAS